MKTPILLIPLLTLVLGSTNVYASTASCLAQAEARIGHVFKWTDTAGAGASVVSSPTSAFYAADDSTLESDRKEVQAIVSESYVGAGEHLSAFLLRVRKTIPSLTYQELNAAITELNSSPECEVDENLNTVKPLEDEGAGFTVDSMINFTNQILAEIVVHLPRITPADITSPNWQAYYASKRTNE